jgi:4-hydroxybenzoate polyprenyltransferase
MKETDVVTKRLRAYLALMRPSHWIKNILVFAAPIFSGKLFDLKLFIISLLGFALYCIAASSVYIANDIVDIENDRSDDTKKSRPLANGIIGLKSAVIAATLLIIISISGSLIINAKFCLEITIYIILCNIYTVSIKEIPLVELIFIALGYVLRAAAGAAIINSSLSIWLILCTFFLSLYIVAEKRKGELEEYIVSGKTSRGVIRLYSRKLLKCISVSSALLSIAVYSVYIIFFSISMWMLITLPFVFYGILRYNKTSGNRKLSQTPEAVLFKDRLLLTAVLLWGIICIIIIY